MSKPTLETVKTICNATPKGANIIVAWDRPCKTRKNCENEIRKTVRMVGRIGIDYDKLKAVQEKRENNELPAENQGLTWGFFVDKDSEPWHIAHNKGLKKILADGTPNPEYNKVMPTTTHYLRLYKGTSKFAHPTTQFFCNGIETPLEAIEGDLLASEKKSDHGDCFNCKIENMTHIHSENLENLPEVKQEKTEPETETVSA